MIESAEEGQALQLAVFVLGISRHELCLPKVPGVEKPPVAERQPRGLVSASAFGGLRSDELLVQSLLVVRHA